jgi:hypothetical protein
MKATIEIRRLTSGILTAHFVEGKVAGSNILTGRSLTNVESAKTAVLLWLNHKTLASGASFDVTWRVIA